MHEERKKRQERGESDLQKFLGKYRDNSLSKLYREKKLIVALAIVALIVTTLSILKAWQLMGLVSLLLAVTGVIYALRDLSDTTDVKKLYGPSSENYEFAYRQCTDIDVGGRRVSISELVPTKSEKDLDFKQMETALDHKEYAFCSPKVDNLLVLADCVPVKRIEENRVHSVSRTYSIREKQFQYLVARVGEKYIDTTNDPKISLESSLRSVAMSVAGEGLVKIGKVGYFDGLLTNEAFRSQLWERHVNQKDIERENSIRDLTRYFPIEEEEGKYALGEFPVGGVSRHIGITTIAITADSSPRLVFFRQNDYNAIGAGKLTASGSGSTDYDDIRKSQNPNDLLEIIKYSMARELCEEGGILGEIASKDRAKTIVETASRTMITGFFRWVDRCGKPEFVGVTKLAFKEHLIPGDNYEVTKLEEDQGIFKHKVTSMQDFTHFKEKLLEKQNSSKEKENENLDRLNLSFMVALERLITISGYRDSTDETERKVFDKVNTFLFGD